MTAAAGIAALAAGAVLTVGGPAQATASYAGKCKDALGVTEVVDLEDLPATTHVVTRCAPTNVAGKPFSGTGLQALTAAGFSFAGTSRYGNAFVCRVNGRPTSTEYLSIPGNAHYQEKCIGTPPASAYWGYWHATNGGAWTYSSYGAAGYKVTGGGFEGWSFEHNKTSSTLVRPRVTPTR